METIPFTDIEKKCLECKCPYFIVWSYYNAELHSCALQGESDVIATIAKSSKCRITNAP